MRRQATLSASAVSAWRPVCPRHSNNMQIDSRLVRCRRECFLLLTERNMSTKAAAAAEATAV